MLEDTARKLADPQHDRYAILLPTFLSGLDRPFLLLFRLLIHLWTYFVLGCRDCLLRCLLDLPRLDAASFADNGQEQVQGLLKRVAAILLGKEQKLPELSIMLVGCPLPVKAFPAISLDNSRRSIIIRLVR